MTKSLFLFILSTLPIIAFSQSIDEQFSTQKMQKDLEVFKEIRHKANSGLYKYRTKQHIDSLYTWADNEIQHLSSYRDFYNLLAALTDYEGSLHNDTSWPEKYFKNLQKEVRGYFPYPLKCINAKWVVNYKDGEIPLGAEITAINNMPIAEVFRDLSIYFTTDGVNRTGKRMGMSTAFGRYYRYYYGLTDSFDIAFRVPDTGDSETVTIESVGFIENYKRTRKRHSYSFDRIQLGGADEDEIYTYDQIGEETGLLTINSFDIGDEDSEKHLIYNQWLDSVFVEMRNKGLENLIVDVRNNGGGTDPNDVLTYSYLTNRSFQESRQVWISFRKIPLLKYYDSPYPRFLRPLGVSKYSRYFRKRFPIEKDGKYYISTESNEMKTWQPNTNAFNGSIYLLIGPRVASAGSLFAALLAGNANTISIGEETMGGYYGHNGHTPFAYVLPNSKINIEFFIDNIEQDVVNKSNQFYNRGVIPDYEIPQTFEDFLNNEDTQMKYVLNLIAD